LTDRIESGPTLRPGKVQNIRVNIHPVNGLKPAINQLTANSAGAAAQVQNAPVRLEYVKKDRERVQCSRDFIRLESFPLIHLVSLSS
jgi:hypothetical protein